ncbi:MAG: polysaccharide deacetylase family protein, partial [Candidatus Margulisiibacteriota bacterium]
LPATAAICNYNQTYTVNSGNGGLRSIKINPVVERDLANIALARNMTSEDAVRAYVETNGQPIKVPVVAGQKDSLTKQAANDFNQLSKNVDQLVYSQMMNAPGFKVALDYVQRYEMSRGFSLDQAHRIALLVVEHIIQRRLGELRRLQKENNSGFHHDIEAEKSRLFSLTNYKEVLVEEGYLEDFRGRLYPVFSNSVRRLSSSGRIADQYLREYRQYEENMKKRQKVNQLLNCGYDLNDVLRQVFQADLKQTKVSKLSKEKKAVEPIKEQEKDKRVSAVEIEQKLSAMPPAQTAAISAGSFFKNIFSVQPLEAAEIVPIPSIMDINRQVGDIRSKLEGLKLYTPDLDQAIKQYVLHTNNLGQFPESALRIEKMLSQPAAISEPSKVDVIKVQKSAVAPMANIAQAYQARGWFGAEFKVLAFHNLDEKAPRNWDPKRKDFLTMNPRDFKDIMRGLLDAGYTFITPLEVKDIRPAEMNDFNARFAMVIFDDGFESARTLAYNALQELGKEYHIGSIPAAISVYTNYLRKNQADEPESEARKRALSVGQIDFLLDEGWELLSHSQTHSYDPAKMITELEPSRNTLEGMFGKGSVRSFVVPGGHCSQELIEASKAAGYDNIFTTSPAPVNPEEYVWPRFIVNQFYVQPGVKEALSKKIIPLTVTDVDSGMDATGKTVVIDGAQRFQIALPDEIVPQKASVMVTNSKALAEDMLYSIEDNVLTINYPKNHTGYLTFALNVEDMSGDTYRASWLWKVENEFATVGAKNEEKPARRQLTEAQPLTVPSIEEEKPARRQYKEIPQPEINTEEVDNISSLRRRPTVQDQPVIAPAPEVKIQEELPAIESTHNVAADMSVSAQVEADANQTVAKIPKARVIPLPKQRRTVLKVSESQRVKESGQEIAPTTMNENLMHAAIAGQAKEQVDPNTFGHAPLIYKSGQEGLERGDVTGGVMLQSEVVPSVQDESAVRSPQTTVNQIPAIPATT